MVSLCQQLGARSGLLHGLNDDVVPGSFNRLAISAFDLNEASGSEQIGADLISSSTQNLLTGLDGVLSAPSET
jgi:hypothetical protein